MTERWKDRSTEGRKCGWLEGWMGRCVGSWMDGWMGGQTDGWEKKLGHIARRGMEQRM